MITSIRTVHKKQNTSTKAYIKKIVNYMTDEEKTQGKTLVSSYCCDPSIADVQFHISKQHYLRNTGRTQKSDVLAYTVLQSFFLDKVSPEKANEIGYKLAKELTKDEHAFIVTTHVNTDNIHNHIIWNSTNLDCDAKWVDVKRSGKDVAKASDRLCMQYGLSVINERQSRKEYSSYGAWKKENDNQNRTQSLRQKLQFAIDEVLEHKPKSLEEFLGAMKNLGYENKVGEHIAFRFKGNKKFLRLRSLDDDYFQENILKKIKEFSDGELSRDGDLKTDFKVEVTEDDNYSELIKIKVADEIVFSSSQADLDFEKSSDYEPISNFDNIQLEEPRAVKEIENPFSLGALKKIKSEIKQFRITTRQIQTTNNKDMSLLLDLQRIKMQGKGTGYERWAVYKNG